MAKWLKFVVVSLLFGLLILIRMYEETLFYDPLISFFKADHSVAKLPDFDTLQLLGNVVLRFVMTTLISLGILWVLFRKIEILKVAGLLYVVLFVILFIAFIIFIQSSESGGHLALFYVRRFLIQPLLILLLIPAFYFQKKA